MWYFIYYGGVANTVFLIYFLSNYFFVKVKINIFEDTDLCNSYYFMEALIGMVLSLEVKEGARYIVFSDLENM